MRSAHRKFLGTLLAATLATALIHSAPRASAQSTSSPPPQITTPDRAEIPVGTIELEYLDGVPSVRTAEQVRDVLDFVRGVNVFNNSFRGASAYAIRKGMHSIGAEDNTSVLFYPELMDSTPLWLTGNADTFYYMATLDLTDGPVVIEQPTDALGAINDMWFQWVIDIGRPGPDRGLGGKYLIVGPGYDGPLPEGGYFVAHTKTNHALYAVRAFIANGNDPQPAVANVKENLKIYPYQPGSYGTPIAKALEGTVKLAGEPKVPEMKFIDGTGKSFNTIPPSDFSFFEMINENVQNEPATSYDVELAGQLAAIGIVKGKPFQPDARMKKSSPTRLPWATPLVSANWRHNKLHPDWAYYPNSMWAACCGGRRLFETPPPLFEDGMFKPLPPTGRGRSIRAPRSTTPPFSTHRR